MGFPRKDVERWQAQGLANRTGAAAPPAKVRKKTGTGDWAVKKQWWAEMCRLPGYFVPIKTVTEKNTGGDRWEKMNRAANQRTVALVTMICHKPLPPLPVTVTLTRYGPRLLDDDNAVSALAHVRDGIADAFGTDDSAKSGITWTYAAQVKTSPGLYGVRIVITPTDLPANERNAR